MQPGLNRTAALVAVLAAFAAPVCAAPGRRGAHRHPAHGKALSADAVVFAPGTGRDNGAIFYLAALNSYQSRRAPQRGRDDLARPRHEPTPSETELAAIIHGSGQRRAVFYATDGSPALFHIRTAPNALPWPMEIGIDPFQLRPYVATWTSLTDTSLKLAQGRVATHGIRVAARLMLAIGTMGRQLRSSPGALCDTELGIHCELDALHHLVKLYSDAGNTREATRYLAATRAVLADQRRIREKFSNLDSIAFACATATDDPSLVWRVEAIAALVTAAHDERLTPAEGARVHSVLAGLGTDPSPTIRKAVAHLTTLPHRMFQPAPPPSQEPRHRPSKRDPAH